MDWSNAWILVLALPAVALLGWFTLRSVHPMSPRRRWALFAVRSVLVMLALLALASPALERTTRQEAVIFVLDHSHSQGWAGLTASHDAAHRLAMQLPSGSPVGVVSAGGQAVVRRLPGRYAQPIEPDMDLMERDGSDTALAEALTLARGLFPPGMARRVVLVGDGLETRGDLEAAAREAALADVRIDALPIAGEPRPDVRAVALRPSRSRLHEGAALSLEADVESSLAGEGRIRLYENGIEVASRPLQLSVGQQTTVRFDRTPDERNLYSYRVVVDGFEQDAIPENDEAMALVDVRGRPLLLYLEGEEDESHYLASAMAREGIRLVTRPAAAMPRSLQELAGFDGVILSDVPAHDLSERSMTLLRDYVEQLGGGFLMIGGRNSFGVGGYYRTPIEEILPVKMKAPDKEEQFSTALALVIDRSGSMSGQKIELCKSAAVATVDMLSGKDYITIVPFDSQAHMLVPITRVQSPAAIHARIATLTAGGGTNIYPGMVAAREQLLSVQAKVRHMIVLTDGHTTGTGYDQLAATLLREGITVSTVGVGQGADLRLLQVIATAGGGQFYNTTDPTNLPRIFTRDAMTHMGKLIREEAFTPRQTERHAMLRGWPAHAAQPLLGYVKTHRKATAQVPLVTDHDDPLLATWRFGLGRVTAFTSDCKSRWAALWISTWGPGYNQFWAQVLREVARPPQGQLMDIQLRPRDQRVEVAVDVLEDAATFRHDARIEAQVFFVPPQALGGGLEAGQALDLEQVGPGRYAGVFHTDEPGVYLVRARSDAQMVSAGIVRNRSGEAATGQINVALLDKVTQLTGGTLLPPDAAALPRYDRAARSHYVELRPSLLKLLILLLLVDVAIRRWDTLRSAADWFAPRRETSP